MPSFFSKTFSIGRCMLTKKSALSHFLWLIYRTWTKPLCTFVHAAGLNLYALCTHAPGLDLNAKVKQDHHWDLAGTSLHKDCPALLWHPLLPLAL